VHTNCLNQYCHKKRRKKTTKNQNSSEKKQSKDRNKQTKKQIFSSMETSLSYFSCNLQCFYSKMKIAIFAFLLVVVLTLVEMDTVDALRY
jgi:predicted histidine transporter YuiF (NhaC family)